MDKMKLTYQGSTIKSKADIEKMLVLLDKERSKSKRLRELELLGYAYFLLNELKKQLTKEV